MIVLILAAIAFSTIAILISKVVLKATTNPQKGEPYECGVPTRGKTWTQFNVGYYLFALIFLVFDVELVFLYPWAIVGNSLKAAGLGMFWFWEMMVYIGIVLAGLWYVWKKGVLDWNRQGKAEKI